MIWKLIIKGEGISYFYERIRGKIIESEVNREEMAHIYTNIQISNRSIYKSFKFGRCRPHPPPIEEMAHIYRC